MKRTKEPWIQFVLLMAITTGTIFLAGCSVSNTDSDGDLVSDEWETKYGFDPAVKNVWSDSDKDGLSDLVEFQLYRQYHLALNPHNPDSDDDGLPDGAELCFDFNCKSYVPGLDTNPDNPDTDFDGITDGMEVGLIRGETIIGSLTNPMKEDSDGDGVGDGLEYWFGNDPNRPDSPSFYEVSPPVAQPGAKVRLDGKRFGQDPSNLCIVINNGIAVRPDAGSDKWTIHIRVPDQAKLHPWSDHQIQVVCNVNGLPYTSNTDKNLIVVDPAKNEFPQDIFYTPPDNLAQFSNTYIGMIEEKDDENSIAVPLSHGGIVTAKASILDPNTGKTVSSNRPFKLVVINNYFMPFESAEQPETEKSSTTIIATLNEPGKYFVNISAKTLTPVFYRVEVSVKNLP